jgi:hypothetical protein
MVSIGICPTQSCLLTIPPPLRKCTFSTFGARVEIVFKGPYIVSSKSCCPRPLPGLWNLLTPPKSLQQTNFWPVLQGIQGLPPLRTVPSCQSGEGTFAQGGGRDSRGGVSVHSWVIELSMGLDFRRLNAFANPRLHDMVVIGSFSIPCRLKDQESGLAVRS